jgi:hypothetical protein
MEDVRCSPLVQPSVRVAPASAPPPSARLVARLGGLLTGNDPLRIFTTIARHRRLSRWWLPFAGTLLLRGCLPRLDTEVLIMRTAWNCDGWYEWVQHVPLALGAGLGPAQIAGTAHGPDASCWTPGQRLLVEVADELHARRVVGDRTWDRLSAELGTEECIEVCFVVGHYEMLAMALNSLGVQPESTALAKLDPATAALAAHLRDNLARWRAEL